MKRQKAGKEKYKLEESLNTSHSSISRADSWSDIAPGPTLSRSSSLESKELRQSSGLMNGRMGRDLLLERGAFVLRLEEPRKARRNFWGA